MKTALLPLLLLALPAAAAETAGRAVATAGTAATDPMSSGYLLKLVIGLLMVLALIFVFAWAARKMRLTPAGQQGVIRVLSAISVGQRERIALIQVGDEQILIGLSPGRIQTLHHLETPVDTDLPPEQGKPGVGFAERLHQLMNPPGSCR
jgi:flagellar protein FliO/FliZ